MRNARRSSRLAAWFLTAAMILSMLPASSFAENAETSGVQSPQNEQTQDQDLHGQELSEQGADADAPGASSAPGAQDNHIKSPDEVTEKDIIDKEEDRTVYDLGGGQQMAVFYDAPVRYEDEDGKLTDYDPSLVELEEPEAEETACGKPLIGYSHVNAAGDSRQYIPEVMVSSTPLLMEKGQYAVTMTPSDNTLAMLGIGESHIRLDEEETTDIYDETVRLPLSAVYEAEEADSDAAGTKNDGDSEETISSEARGSQTGEASDEDAHQNSIKYTSGEYGVKETITLASRPQSNTLEYELDLGGLVPVRNEEGEGYCLIDESKDAGEEDSIENTAAVITPAWMDDADRDSYSEGIRYELVPIYGASDGENDGQTDAYDGLGDLSEAEEDGSGYDPGQESIDQEGNPEDRDIEEPEEGISEGSDSLSENEEDDPAALTDPAADLDEEEAHAPEAPEGEAEESVPSDPGQPEDQSSPAYTEGPEGEISPSGKYLLRMIIDEEYLDDPETRYPVTIDPSFTWTGSSNIMDAYVKNGSYANTNYYGSSHVTILAGKNTSGVQYQTFIKFPGLTSEVSGKSITSAYLRLYEKDDCQGGQTIRAYAVASAWTLPTLTWNNKPSAVAPRTGSITTSGTTYKSHDLAVTNFVRNIAYGNASNYGIVLKNKSSTLKYCSFYGSRTSSKTHGPKLICTYTTPPEKASDLKPSPRYLKSEADLTINWKGINSDILSKIQLRVAKVNDNNTFVTDANFVPYFTLKKGNLPSGSVTLDGASFSAFAEGRYRFYVRGVDKNGAAGTGKYMSVYVDRTKPTLSSASITSSTAGNIYQGDNVTISYSGASDKYLSEVQYSLNNKDYKKIGTGTSGSIIVKVTDFPLEGDNEVRARAKDKAGNYSTVKTLHFYADTNAPQVGSVLVGGTDVGQIPAGTYYKLMPQIVLTGISDTGSGLAATPLKIALVKEGAVPKNTDFAAPPNGSLTQEYDQGGQPLSTYRYSFDLGKEVLKSGRYMLFIRVCDKAGNYYEKEISYGKDNNAPKAGIEVKNVRADINASEGGYFEGQVAFTGIVSDADSGIEDSEMTLYKELSGHPNQIDSNTAVTIYDSQTCSKTSIFDTTALDNGKYIVQLVATDKANNVTVLTKAITISNRLPKPMISGSSYRYSNVRNIQLAYSISVLPAGRAVSAVSTSLDGENWTDTPASGASGTVGIMLPAADGIYTAYVRGVDEDGLEGRSSSVTIELDTSIPAAEISTVSRRSVYGLIEDANISGWKIETRKQLTGGTWGSWEEVYEDDSGSGAGIPYTGPGTGSTQPERLCTLTDLDDEVYQIRLTAEDKAGNTSSDTYLYDASADDGVILRLASDIEISRDGVDTDTARSFTVRSIRSYLDAAGSTAGNNLAQSSNSGGSGILPIGGGYSLLTGSSDTGMLRSGSGSSSDITWYIDGSPVENADVLDLQSLGSTIRDGSSHRITAVERENGSTRYSSDLLKGVLKEEITGQDILDAGASQAGGWIHVEWDEELVSFTPSFDASRMTVKVKEAATDPDSSAVSLTSGSMMHISDICEELETDGFYVKATPLTGITISSSDTIELFGDVLEGESFRISKVESYRAEDITAADKINYKTYLRWGSILTEDASGNGGSGQQPLTSPVMSGEDISANVSYQVFASTEQGFTPADQNMAAEDIKDSYYSDIDLDFGRTIYYRVRAVVKDSEGHIIDSSSFSSEVSSRCPDGDELTKRLGDKEYWEYAELEMPSADVKIEKSRGNLVYTQQDALLANEELDVKLERTYNSKSSVKTAFGFGTTHNYDMELVTTAPEDDLSEGLLIFMDETGTIYYFDKKDGDDTYISSMGKYVKLIKEEGTQELSFINCERDPVTITYSYKMVTKDNITYFFNSGGQLLLIREEGDNFILLEYDVDRGSLSDIVTSRGYELDFCYEDANGHITDLVREVRLPDGSKSAYTYDSDDMLTAVRTYGKTQSEYLDYTYEYDNDGNMTDIIDADGTDFKVAYDAQDRAVSFTYPQSVDGQKESVSLTYDGNTTTTSKRIGTAVYTSEEDTFQPHTGYVEKSTDCDGEVTRYDYRDDLRVKTTYDLRYQTVENGVVVDKVTAKTEETAQDEEGNITEETDESGASESYEYENDEAISDVSGQDIMEGLPSSCTEYDGEENLETDESYSYDEYGNLILVYDEVTDTSIYRTYDEEGEMTSEKEIEGEAAVDEDGDLVLDQDAKVENDAVYTNTYDEHGNKTQTLTETADDATVITVNVYDPCGRELSEEVTTKDSNDAVVSYKKDEYTLDGFGRTISETTTERNGNSVPTVTTETTSYYPSGKVQSTTDAKGVITDFTYDSIGRELTEVIHKGSSTRSEITSYGYETISIYDGKGMSSPVKCFVTTIRNEESEIIEKTYQDPKGRTIRENKNGIITDIVYDRSENVIAKTEYGQNEDPQDCLTELDIYDELGNLTAEIKHPEVSSGSFVIGDDTIITTSTYDSNGSVISETDANGNTSGYTYDAQGQITEAVTPEGTQVTAAYDLEVTSNEFTGSIIPQAMRDGLTKDTVTDPLGRRSETVKDAQDRTVAQRDVGTGSSLLETVYEYDASDRLVKETEKSGRYQTTEYDNRDRKSRVSFYDANDVLEKTSEYTYDVNDLVLSEIDKVYENGSGSIISAVYYGYDAFERKISESQLLEGDIEGSVPSQTEIDDHKRIYTYDAKDNLLSVTYPEAAVKGSVTGLEYTYDAANRLTQIKAVIDTGSGTVRNKLRDYTYTPDGKVASTRDYRDFAAAVPDLTKYTLKTFTYDIFDRVTSIEYTLDGDTDVLESYTYEYDKNSNITKETRYSRYEEREDDDGGDEEEIEEEYDPEIIGNGTGTGTGTGTDAGDPDDDGYVTVDETREYIYDCMDRMVQETVRTASDDPVDPEGQGSGTGIGDDGESFTVTAYAYDAAGNKISETTASTVKTFTYDSLNQLTHQTELDGSETESDASFTYDADGNMTVESDTVKDVTKAYGYDSSGCMTSAMITSGGIVTVDQKNTYTGEGTRIAKDENGRKTQYYYDGDGLLYTAASESAGTLLEGQTDAGDALEDNIADLGDDRYITAFNYTGTSGNVIASARYDGEESFCFYNKDGRESTTNILDSEGKAGASYTYTTFGETAKLTGSISNEICYCGSIYDETTALYYLKSRYYDPSEGVFLTADDQWGDAKDALSLNRYAYAQDNPVTYTDPDGHFPIWAAVGAAMGAHDGYRYAKKKRYRGWKRAACIVGGAALGAVNPFKCLRVARHARTAYKVARKFKRGRGIVRRTKRFVRKVSKYRKYRKVIRHSRSQQKRLRCAKKPAKKKFKVQKRKTGVKVSQKQKSKHSAKGCFVAGTLVSTDDGEVPIEKIKEGDLVWSKDPETGEIALKAVKKVFVKESDEIIRLTVDGEMIETTPPHVFYTEEYGWISAGYLEEGITLLLQSGKKVKIDSIDNIFAEESVRVYNFEVDEYHVYFVSNYRVLVHNKCPKERKDFSSRRAAFRQAKRDAKIPMSRHPDLVRPAKNKRGKKISGREYVFKKDKKIIKEDIVILEHSEGHSYPDDGTHIGPHFNYNGMHYMY